MKTKAAVAFAAAKPLEIAEVDLDGPKSGEVLIEIKATGVCHTDAFTLSGYLGGDYESNKSSWANYDAVEIIKDIDSCVPILIDQGSDDEFLEEQLNTDLFIQSISNKNLPINVRYQEGYDHSYFFISSFIDQHIKFHSEFLS